MIFENSSLARKINVKQSTSFAKRNKRKKKVTSPKTVQDINPGNTETKGQNAQEIAGILKRSEEIESALLVIIRNSPLFNESWYKNNYNDIKDLDIDFARHYLKYGWKQGKSPSFNFSSKLYLEANKDIAALDINPLIHYELRGKYQHKLSFSYDVEIIFYSDYFDGDFYSNKYGLNNSSRLEACLDYIKCGDATRTTSNHFNPVLYLSAYPDVEASGIAALLHYELHGCKEERRYGLSDTSAKFLEFENKENITTPAKRICLFACYSANGTIADETVYLLEKIRSISDAIILVGDCGINPAEYEKIKHLIFYAKFERHLEYDFGSYKRAFAYAEKENLLADASEILVCNDSIVGPCGDINDFFLEREKDGNPNFYGITVNNFGFRNISSNGNSLFSPHIQSYFFTITKEIFESPFWKTFIYSVKNQEHKIDIIRNYEMGMSKLLKEHGHPPKSMYKSKVGLNPAALETIDVLNNALFIKKSMLQRLTSEKSGIISGIFKAKRFPFEIKEGQLVSTILGNAQTVTSLSPKLKIVDSEIIGETVFLFVVSGKVQPSLELLISSEKRLMILLPVDPVELNNEKYQGIIGSYQQRSLLTYVFKFDLSLITNGATLDFSNSGEVVPIEYIYGSFPCHNFMKHRDLSLYPRIERNTLFLSQKEKSILAIMLSENYSAEDKQLFALIINSKNLPKYNLFSERSSLACDNAYEAFKYNLEYDDSCFYITSKAVIASEKNTKIKSHMIEFGSTQHREMFLSAKNLFCSFGYPGIMASGLKDIHITALNYKLYLMWHGISAGDKNSYEIAAFNGNSSDGVFACSSYEEAYFKKLGHKAVYLTGYPRMDKWSNDEKLDANALILFFTWRRNLLHSNLADFLHSEYVRTIVELVVRITAEHPKMHIYYFIHNSVPSRHSELLAAILRSKNTNIRFVNNNDQLAFNKIFNSSQYMITDYSSVGYDFAYYKERSPIFYMPEKFIAGHYIPTELFSQIQPGVQALEIDAVIEAIRPDEYKKHQASTKKFFTFTDGNNCKRSYQALTSPIV